ncbi:hypothetical protein D3C87_2197390 [compost metagenome]
MKAMNAVGWINTKNEIASKIIEAIQQPENVGADRKKWLQKVVHHPLDKCTENLVTEILK